MEIEHFWRRVYCVDIVGKNTKQGEYINNELKQDWMIDQIRFSKYINLFMGEKIKVNKNSRQRRQLGK